MRTRQPGSLSSTVVTARPGGVVLRVRVVTRAGRTELVGIRDGVLVVRVAAVPVDGQANRVLLELLAGILAVPRSAVRIVAGHRAREKRVDVHGVDLATVGRRLGLTATGEPARAGDPHPASRPPRLVR